MSCIINYTWKKDRKRIKLGIPDGLGSKMIFFDEFFPSFFNGIYATLVGIKFSFKILVLLDFCL